MVLYGTVSQLISFPPFVSFAFPSTTPTLPFTTHSGATFLSPLQLDGCRDLRNPPNVLISLLCCSSFGAQDTLFNFHGQVGYLVYPMKIGATLKLRKRPAATHLVLVSFFNIVAFDAYFVNICCNFSRGTCF